VGGGVGIPPMIYLAEKFQRAGIRAIAFIGAQKADLIPLHITGAVGTQPTSNVREFAAFNTQTVVATDDGSLGNKGFVTQSLERFCETSPDVGAVVFCCGPTPMMRATALVAAKLKLPCYASLEQPMACGMGTCQSCVIKYRPDGVEDWVYKLTCKDGPVFNTTDIMW
ncbi:MAG: iron-sulfur cluster-binding protein, partial [Phycisphaerae bacterium]